MHDRPQNRLAETVANRLQARHLVPSNLPLRPSVSVSGFCQDEPAPASPSGFQVKVGYSDLSTPQDFRSLGQNVALFIGRAARKNAVTWISVGR